MTRVLFSPIGGTDPISNCRDGAMLHICRVYKPDIVYLHMSKEMLEFQRQNDRYRYCIKKLGERRFRETLSGNGWSTSAISTLSTGGIQLSASPVSSSLPLLRNSQRRYPVRSSPLSW